MNIRRGSYDVGFKAEGKLGNAHTLATLRGWGVFEISLLSLMEDVGRLGLHINRSRMYIPYSSVDSCSNRNRAPISSPVCVQKLDPWYMKQENRHL